MSPVERAWLVGILEGEGSFSADKRKSTNGNVLSYPRLALGMTDLDTVERARALMGAGTVYVEDRGATSSRKTFFRIVLVGRAAEALMKEIYPDMSIRRRSQIDTILGAYRPVLVRSAA